MKPVLEPPTATVREQMRRARRADTGPEIALRRALWAAGLRYRTDYAPLPHVRTRADIAFLRARVLVYVDGCFWHGCPQHATWPKNNAQFWLEKIRRNKERDATVTARLLEAGWTVIRVWEHEPPAEAAQRIAARVREARRDQPRTESLIQG